MGYLPKSISDWQDEVHDDAVKHGWWEEPRHIGLCLALIHSEVSEALEDIRDGNGPKEMVIQENGKPTGFPSEMADIVIRVMDLCGHLGVDLENAMKVKAAYNRTRPYRHGGKTA